MLLTDEEMRLIAGPRVDYFDHAVFGRAIEAKILAKLASAELPEPDCLLSTNRYGSSPDAYPVYTADQLRQAYAQGYAQGAASQLSAEPEYYVYRVNGLRWNSSAGRPHEDDYDEGTLIELYTRKEAK